MRVKWENMEIVIMQAGGLLLTRRSQRLRRAGGGDVESTKELLSFIQRTQQRPLVPIPVPPITLLKIK